MADRPVLKARTLNLTDFPDLSVIVSRFLDNSSSNFLEFLTVAERIDKELNLVEPEELLMSKDMVLACCKAVHDVLDKALKEIVKESDESLQSLFNFFNKTRVIFYNFLWVVRKVQGKIRLEKGVIGNIKSIMMWALSKPHNELLVQDFFLMLTLVFEAVLYMKKTGLKEQDLVQVTDMLVWLVDSFCDKRFFKLSDAIFSFKAFAPAGIYHRETLECDLVYYLLVGVETMLKIETSHLTDFVKNCLPNLLDYIYDVFQRSEGKVALSTELAVEKYLAIFQIFRNFSGHAKPEISKSFLKNNSDRIKNVFFYILLNYISSYFSCTSSRFEEDDGILAKIYKFLLEIINIAFIGSDQEGFPIIFCSVILQKVREKQDICQELHSRPPQVQAFTLQFIEKLLVLLGGKRREVSFDYLRECRVIEILFSVPLFEVKDSTGNDFFGYQQAANETWEKIWTGFVIKDRKQLKWVGKAIVESIRFSCEDVLHLVKINKWVQEQALLDEELVDACIASGLLETFFLVISYVKRNKVHSGHLAEFFMTLKVLLGQFQGNELKNSDLLMSAMIQDNYLYDNEVSELCLDCLAYILKFQNDSNYCKFCNLLKQVDNISVKIKLLGTMQNILKQKEIKKKCQEGFVRAKAFSALKEVIIRCPTEDELIIQIWVNVLESVRFLIEENPICKKSLQEFDFNQVATTIRSDRYRKIRSEIYMKSIESLLYILFETNNLGRPQLRAVKTPEVIPLVIELLSDCENLQNAQEYFSHLSVCIEDGYNAAHFANYRTADLLLDAFMRTSSEELIKFIENTLPLVICHHITPQELKKIIEISQIYSKNKEKRRILFKCLANGVKNCFCQTGHFKFAANHTCLSPTRYFCFRSFKSLLKFSVEGNENLLPSRDFSVFFWVFPDNNSRNSVIFMLSGSHSSSLMVSFIAGNVVVEYFQEKLIFAVAGLQGLNEKQWNLVAVNFKSLSGLLFKNDRGEVEIFINYNKVECDVRGKVLRPKEIFNKIVIGNTENLGNPFFGRVASFYILKKQLTLNHYQEIFYLSFQYNLGFNPDALTTSEHINADKSTLKFIYENLTFSWYPRGRFPEFQTSSKSESNFEVTDECERFNGVSIIESIAANGGLKIFLPIIQECAEHDSEHESFINLLAIIADVCVAQSVEMILDEDFFNTLTFILEESIKKPDVQLVDALINIVGHLEWNSELNSQSFKSLFLNKKLWKGLEGESLNHYSGTLSLNIKKHFKCDPETLYGIFDQLACIQQNFCESFVEIWQNLIPENVDSETVDGVLMLIFTIFEKSPGILMRFVEMLAFKRFKKETFENVHFSVLFLMKVIKDGTVQACLLKFLLKLIEDHCEEIAKDKRASLSRDEFEFIGSLTINVDKCLDNNILPETFSQLLVFCKKAIDSQDRKKAEKFQNFFEILTTRLVDCQNKKKFCKILLKECKSELFSLLLFDTRTFPDWLQSLYPSIPVQMEALALKLFFNSRSQRTFNKLRRFLMSIPLLDPERGLTWSFLFYHKLLTLLQSSIDHSKDFALQMLDFFGVLEDLLDSKENLINRESINLDVYVPLIEDIIKTSQDLHLIFSSFPGIPNIGFNVLISALKELVQPELDENSVYLRDGGFLRLALKFIFVGLEKNQDIRLVACLKKVLKGGDLNAAYLTSSNEQRKFWDSRFNQNSFQRFSQFYVSFMDKGEETINGLKFLAMYVVAECVEILEEGRDNPLLEFLKEFVLETDAFGFIEGNAKPTDIELEYFYRLLESKPNWVYPTSRCRYDLIDRNKHKELLSNFLGHIPSIPDSKTFMSGLKEMFQSFRSQKDSPSSLLTLLLSESWTTRVHFFFLASTSMKLNFFSHIVVSDIQQSPLPKSEESFDRIEKSVQSKQDFFKSCKKRYEQRLDRSRRVAQKNYKMFCKTFTNLKNVLAGNDSGKLRVKEVSDKIGRMPFLERKTNKDPVFNLKKARLSLTSPLQIQTRFLDQASNEGSSDLLSDSDEEEVLVASSNLQDVISFECEKIKLHSSVFGFLEISQDYLLYISEGKEKPKGDLYFGSALDFTMVQKKTEKIWKISDFQEVFPRRFIHRFTAFEVFLKSGKTLYFNLFSEDLCKKALDSLKGVTRKLGKIVQDPSKLFKSCKKLWLKGSISNMEYLMQLNKLSSRSFNDISQYPVFPWVLKDFESPRLRLDDAEVFRNLSFPVGAQSEEGRQEAERKFSNFEDEEVDSFHYGSHYSSAGIVLHFLVRLDPYTEMAKNLQGGNFDVSDRLFYSMQAAWESGQGTTGDVKELVPQLFYLPEVLENVNGEDFGTRQDLKRVDHVELPPWASSAADFVVKHRRALESAFVSSHLNEWIDLIFGCKQKGEGARVSFNKFNSLTYEDYFKTILRNTQDFDSIQGLVEQVVHFGQTPVQLLKVPHPVKDFRTKNLDFFDRWKMGLQNLESESFRSNGKLLALLSNSIGTWLVKTINGTLQVISLKDLNMDKVIPNRLEGVQELKLSDWEEAVQWKLTFNSSHLQLMRSSEQYCLWSDDFLISGFHIDNSFKVHSLKGSLVKSIHHHAGLVTCVTSTSSLLFTGSMDTSIASWSTLPSKDDRIKPFQIYLGHSEAIRQLAVQEKYNFLLSLSITGLVLMHEVQSGECLRRVAYSHPIRLVAVSEYGLFAVYIEKVGIKVISFNGSELASWLKKKDLQFMRFSDNGECLVFAAKDEFYFIDVVDTEYVYEKACDGGERFSIQTFAFSGNKEQLFLAFNSDEELKVWKF